MLYGLTGEARCGKDTVAKMLNIPEYHFSKPMKDACRIIFGWNDEHLYGELKEVVDPNFGVSPREALQTLGTEWGRGMIDNHIWLKRAQIEINNHSSLVVSDVRFDNEARLIKQNGGVIIEVVRDVKVDVRQHSSEAGINRNFVDYIIHNDGSFDDLRSKVNAIKLSRY